MAETVESGDAGTVRTGVVVCGALAVFEVPASALCDAGSVGSGGIVGMLGVSGLVTTGSGGIVGGVGNGV